MAFARVSSDRKWTMTSRVRVDVYILQPILCARSVSLGSTARLTIITVHDNNREVNMLPSTFSSTTLKCKLCLRTYYMLQRMLWWRKIALSLSICYQLILVQTKTHSMRCATSSSRYVSIFLTYTYVGNNVQQSIKGGHWIMSFWLLQVFCFAIIHACLVKVAEWHYNFRWYVLH